jgi:CelD/BcsL family acetyltransferase involved in cellulose biosynthesis
MDFAAIGNRPFASVEVFHDVAAVHDIWEELETAAPVSIYQTRAFLISWIETLGAAQKIAPLFVVAKDRDGRPVLLLCLGIKTAGPLRIGRFLGEKATNFDMPLCRPGVVWTRADLEAVLSGAAAKLGAAAPDVFALRDQPFEWKGFCNPLALLPHRPSPHVVLATRLESDSETFLESKLSGNARRQLRVKEARLAELLGPVELISNDTAARADAILAAFFAQRTVRFHAHDIDADFSDPAMQAFWTRLGRPTAAPAAVEFYALTAGGRIVATIAGATHAGCFSFAVNSIDTDPEIDRTSPGVLLINKLIALQCQKGVEQFDSGPGEERYKLQYCDRRIELFDVFVPLRLRGRLFAVLRAEGSRLKRALKRNPRLFESARWLKRKFRAGLAGGGPKP